MPIPKIPLSQIELELEEVACLQKALQAGTYEQHIAFQLSNVVNKLRVTITVELEGMELLVLNTVLNDIIGVSAASDDVVKRLAGTQRKVQAQITKRYREILAAQ